MGTKLRIDFVLYINAFLITYFDSYVPTFIQFWNRIIKNESSNLGI